MLAVDLHFWERRGHLYEGSGFAWLETWVQLPSLTISLINWLF